MRCRHCDSALDLTLVDLGSAPASNAYLSAQALKAPELWYPLRVLVCEECWLVQTEDFTRAEELFDAGYAYFSGFSTSWLQHAERYVADMTRRFDLNAQSLVVEVASNDGYLLQYVQERGIPCLGVEPTAGTAAAARDKGIPVVEEFFGAALGKQLVQEGRSADLMVANNVLAHVPDIDDFALGFTALLKERGVATFEFPHLMKLLAENQFDTILPRALLISFTHGRRAGIRPRRTCNIRCRGVADARGELARLRAAPGFWGTLTPVQRGRLA